MTKSLQDYNIVEDCFMKIYNLQHLTNSTLYGDINRW